MKKILLIILTLTMMCACKQKASWPLGWDVRPAECLDSVAMDEHFAAHPDRWKAVFDYLKNTDLAAETLGEHELLGRDVYAIVSEYEPKKHENCQFEAHRLYIDVQYIISGEEMMGVVPLDKTTETVPYVEDIAFYGTEYPDAVYEKATPEKFFVFFPKDAHRPSMESTEGVMVKKVVVKVKF